MYYGSYSLLERLSFLVMLGKGITKDTVHESRMQLNRMPQIIYFQRKTVI